MILTRRAVPALLVALLGACAGEDLSQTPAPLGNFELGYNVVVAKNAQTVGPSRKAAPEEWQTALKAAVAQRIGRYRGGKLYHLGIGVNAYALAVPGIPVVLNPKSVLVITVDVWDDTAQRIINAEPKQITVFEPFSGSTLIGSGLTQRRDAQLQALARNAARAVDKWLIENAAWFSPEAAAARAVLGPQPGAPRTAAGVMAAAAATPAPPATSPSTAPAPVPAGVVAPPAKKPLVLPPAPSGQTIGLP